MNSKSPGASPRDTITDLFARHVSSGKVDFFRTVQMDLVMGERQGAGFSDINGRREWINLHCNGGVFNLGHRNPELVDTLKESLDHLDIGNSHLISAERAQLAERIAHFMPGDLDYTVFGSSGGEAVDLAIKIARGYTGRSGIVSARGGYHGHTGLALAAGDEKYRAPFGPCPPGFTQVPFGDPAALEREMGPQTAAVLLETVPATLGMVIPPPDYLPEVRHICDRNGSLLILDEVQTGLGRTGRLWAFEHFDVLPDVVVLGKGLSGGLYPLAATVFRSPLEAVFHPDPFIHVSTFGGGEVGCPVSRKVLEISAASDFLSNVNRLASLFREGVDGLMQRYPDFLTGFHQLGLMMGLVTPDSTCGPILSKTAFDNGLLMVYANNAPSICQFLPPLTITDQQVQQVFRRLDRAIRSAREAKTYFEEQQRHAGSV